MFIYDDLPYLANYFPTNGKLVTALLYSTLLYSSLLFSTLLYSRGFNGFFNISENCDFRSQFDPLNIICYLFF